MNYLERLNNVLIIYKEDDINNYTYLYSSFQRKKIDYDNYIYRERLLPMLKKQFDKRSKKDDFNKKLFSKILFNNLYSIRQHKDDLIPYGVHNKPNDNLYKYCASHQRIRRELEKLDINQLMRLSYELTKHFRKNK